MPHDSPAIHVLRQGNLANQMIQHMVATKIADEVPGCKISNVNLPAWNIGHPELPSAGGPEELVDGHDIDVGHLASELRSGRLQRVNLLAFGQRIANFPSASRCEALFPPDIETYPGYGPDALVCGIRGAEILDGHHPHYTLLPIRFYAEVAEKLGLRLVFTGQIEDNVYCADLQRNFPDAVFRESQGALADFQTFRNSCNVLPAVSTFSWLAAWLSNARRIVQPVSGLFHPVQMPDVDLLPLDDPRYEFHLFPINFSVPVDRYYRAHAAMSGLWRQVSPEMIAAMRGGPRWPRRMETFKALLDEAFYLATYVDIEKLVAAGVLPNGASHYATNGFTERRRAFSFDRRWYCITYPLAAFEVGQGDYESLQHHYAEIGAARGYLPVPG